MVGDWRWGRVVAVRVGVGCGWGAGQQDEGVEEVHCVHCGKRSGRTVDMFCRAEGQENV